MKTPPTAGAQPPPTNANGYELIVRTMHEVPDQELVWEWPGFIYAGGINVLVASGGLGKTTLAAVIAGVITNGEQWPCSDIAAKPGKVLVLLGEEPEFVFKKRLQANGADLSRVVSVPGKRWIDKSKVADAPINFKEDAERIEALVAADTSIRCIIFDPFGSFTGVTLSANKDSEVREMLYPIRAVAEKYGVSIILLCHTRKADVTQPLDKILGSVAIGNFARSACFISPTDDPDVRILTQGKNNYGRRRKSLKFRITDPDPGRIVWLGETSETAEQMVAPPRGGHPSPGQTAAIAFLQAFLTDGPQPKTEVEKAAEKAGHAGSLRRAFNKLNVQWYQVGGKGRCWWSLTPFPANWTPNHDA